MFGTLQNTKECGRCQSKMKLSLTGPVLKAFIVEEILFFGGLGLFFFSKITFLKGIGIALLILSVIIPLVLVAKLPKSWVCKSCGYKTNEKQ